MTLRTQADVLIIGAGPAGLMCANALANAGVDVQILDKRPTRVTVGQADGIQPRTIEIFQSYGLGERLIREGNHIYMSAHYNPGPNGGIVRTQRTPSVTATIAPRYPFGITHHQGAVEGILIDSMKEFGVEVERPCEPTAIEISEDEEELSSSESYPVKVTVIRLDAMDDEKRTRVIHAKYVVGADGAHSWTRKALGIEMMGEQSDYIWGVLDINPETNFPDIRSLCIIHSPSGTCKVIPREEDKVRLYIQLSDADIVDPTTGRVDKSRITPQTLMNVFKEMVRPYEWADPKEIDWWTVYIIGQRVASSFDVKGRVFIAGDACHTHSPKVGQGVNASMSDTHNLAWKLVQVLRGWSKPSLLKTYELERRNYALDLIDLDKKVSALFSSKQRTENPTEDFIKGMRTLSNFISGLGICYTPSAIVDITHQACAANLVIGQRMQPYTFIRAADARPIDIQDLLPADVRFKLLFFVGHLTENRVCALRLLAERLSSPLSWLYKYTGGEVEKLFDVVTIVAGSKEDVDHLTVPDFYRPHWSKVLLDDRDMTGRMGGDGYKTFGIDAEEIVLVVVRPDGHVGTVVPSTSVDELDAYFGSFMVPKEL